MEAEIVLEYDDSKTAETVTKAVSPDNLETLKDLTIKTTRKDRKVLTMIESSGKLSTLIATIDDLLFCASIAERTLHVMRKVE